MRKLLPVALLAVLLCGCAAEPPTQIQDTTGTQTIAAVEPTEPAGTRQADSAITEKTGGAVTAYATEIPEAYALTVMGEDVVIFSGTSATTLTRLTGENRYINASVSLSGFLSPDMPSVLVNEKSISFYDGADLVTLGTGLKEIGRIPLPEELVGQPVVSADRKLIYYGKADSLWEFTVETGIHRKIKEVTGTLAGVNSLLMDGQVLGCALESGEQIFLSTQTGQTLWQGDALSGVTGSGENWYARVPEGQLTVCIYGTGEEKRMLLPQDYRSEGWYLEENGYWLTASDLCCYDLDSGKKLSQLELTEEVLDVAEDAQGFLWLLTADGMVYRWNPAALPSGDDTVYSGPRYTLLSPDPEGYASLQAMAAELEQRYHLNILFGMEAVAVQHPDYTLTGEFLVPILREELEKLEQWIMVFPEEMLKMAVEDSTGGKLYLCLVRQVIGQTDEAGGCQHWQGEDSYVALAAGQDTAESLYHQLYHVLEIRLLSESNACYEWDSLNPKGFDYDYSFAVNKSREDTRWVEDDRYFIDISSMSFPMEDRAQIFAFALGEGNEAYFESKAMQRKLLALCKGLREAYGLTKSPESFAWEQYLTTSLAYTK